MRDWSKFPAPVVGIWVHIGEPLEATRGRDTRLLLDYMPHELNGNIADFRLVKPPGAPKQLVHRNVAFPP